MSFDRPLGSTTIVADLDQRAVFLIADAVEIKVHVRGALCETLAAPGIRRAGPVCCTRWLAGPACLLEMVFSIKWNRRHHGATDKDGKTHHPQRLMLPM